MPGTLILNNGQEVTGSFVEADGRLFLYLYGIRYEDAFALLSVAENVKTIRMESFGQERTAKGYTELYTITRENGFVSAGLRK